MTVMTLNAPGTFSWVELCTPDAGKARTFYTRLFNWDVHEMSMGPDNSYFIFRVGGKDVAAMYQLTADQKTKGVTPHWLSYVTVTDADAAAAHATKLGGTVLAPPFDVGDIGRMAMIQDPQGGSFALWQAKEHGGIGRRGEVGTLGWNELMSSDIKAGTSFYQELFSWKTEMMSMPGMDYTIFQNDGKGVGGGMQRPGSMANVPTHWLPYFIVENCDAVLAQATRLGATVPMPAHEAKGVGRWASIIDPSGAAFAVLQPDPDISA
jgi:uncharacterized protein